MSVLPDQDNPNGKGPGDPFAGLTSDHLHLWREMLDRLELDGAGRPYVTATAAQLAFVVRHSTGHVRRLRCDLERAGLIEQVRRDGLTNVVFVRVIGFPPPEPGGAPLTRRLPSTPVSPVRAGSPWAREAHVPRSPARQAAHVGRARSRSA